MLNNPWLSKEEMFPGVSDNAELSAEVDKLLLEIVSKNLLETKEENGKTLYRASQIGTAWLQHANSDPGTRS